MRAFWAIALLCLVVPATTFAQTTDPALTVQERALCRPDALRLCLFKLGNAGALRQCLRDNRDNLSAPCLDLLKTRGN